MSELFSTDAEEEQRLRAETLYCARRLVINADTFSCHVPTVVGNLLAMYDELAQERSEP